MERLLSHDAALNRLTPVSLLINTLSGGDQTRLMLAQDCGGRIDALYPTAPVYANSAANMAALMTYRLEFLRRTNKNKTMYKHPSTPGEHEQLLIGDAVRSILKLDGRVSKDKVPDPIPPEKRNIVPPTFGAVYTTPREEIQL